jgi:hypothetical protein
MLSLPARSGRGEFSHMATPKNQAIKLSVALALLLAAGVIVAWSQGLFGGKEPPPAPPTADEQKQFDDAQNRTEQRNQQNKNVVKGAS